MKPLENHLILFDAECPMCTAYTKAMVRTGLLEESGRSSYQDLEAAACPMVDRQRAADEIALVNLETGEVSYGISSLFRILAGAAPLLKPLLLFGPFIWLMSKVYGFVAANRRVIAPPQLKAEGFSIQPTFRLGYRIAYILISLLLTAYLLTAYILLLNDPLPIGDFLKVFALLTGQLIVQAVIIPLVAKNKTWSYLGNLVTINFLGALLLVPLLILSAFVHLPIIVSVVYLVVVITLLFLEHFRRSNRLGTGLIPVVTWALYTFFVVT